MSMIWKYLKRRTGGYSKYRQPRKVPSPKPTVPRYQNSYRLDAQKPFNVEEVDKIVKMVLENHLEDASSYDPKESSKLCSEIAAEIRQRVQKLEFDRYKLAVVVTIMEKASQSFENSMGFIWDVQRDNYSTYVLETRTFYAYCCVFGIYYE